MGSATVPLLGDNDLPMLDGGSARWMLYSLGFSLTGAGAQLAARAMLERLEGFEGRQLATYGTTGIPLMQSIILASGGRYRHPIAGWHRTPPSSGARQ